MPPPTIEPTREQFAAFAARTDDRPVTMLNLLRFRETADYHRHPDLAPPEPISGRAAYGRYSEVAATTVAEVGGEVVFSGAAGPSLIGPSDERWDAVLLVRYPSQQAFLDMMQMPAYQAVVGHRSAALADSRLVPTT